ncbi:MAG: hypothetical protein GYA34_16635 [Chloroflexi bacterium]|nr:hypothetical protein [Chloroflexota bacterium]
MSEANGLFLNIQTNGGRFYFRDDPLGRFLADCRLQSKINAVWLDDFWLIERNRKIA